MDTAQIAWVAARFKRVTLEHNTVVFSEGSPADNFYMILDGKVRVTQRKRGGGEELLNVLGQGDFFGEEALLFDRPRTASVHTLERTTFLRLERDQFITLLKHFPQIRMNLSATASSRRLARRIHFDWLGPDEVIYLLARKNDFFLLLALIGPIILGVGSVPVLAYAFTQIDNPLMFRIAAFLGGFMLLGSIFWGIWNWIDWGNDYYIVTNQRVVWLEKVVGLYDSRREAPLETVLAVNVVSSQLGRILHYGDITLRTFTGGILMRHADRPNQFAQYVEGYKKRVIMISKEEETKQIEQSLEQALRKQEVVEQNLPVGLDLNEPPPPAAPVKTKVVKPLTFKERMENFLKVRFERDGVITYRKHWFLLVQKAWQPVLAMTVLLIIVIILAWVGLNQGLTLLSEYPIFIIGFLVFIGISMWLGYYLWDWSNDIYRLTEEMILDIERRPLGREEKKTAPLESILSIEHERANIWGIIFNFGTVTINVGQTKFVFYGVYNPDQVHADISDHREALIRKKRNAEANRDREKMVNWLVAFHEETEKLEDFENNSGEGQFSG
ncbi:MAG TPA: cyclic nucleotide-binding domain-containing protein [Anaerolineales bacterium]